jgi:uncharacterized protein (DUF427 family)
VEVLGLTTPLPLTPAVAAARAQWQYRGQRRPPFALAPGPGQLSVWDFPRPPRIEAVRTPMRVTAGETLLAETTRGCRVVETAGAPTYYFPPGDVAVAELTASGRTTLCEWKGLAQGYAWQHVSTAAWCYAQTFAEFVAIRGWFAFYPAELACFVGVERVTPQPGGYYGGWVTPDLCGPIKGGPGSGHW